MATVTASDGRPLSEEEQVQALIQLGMSLVDARFLVAFEAGRVNGDVIVVDDEGNPVPRGPQPTIVDLDDASGRTAVKDEKV